mgnify:CR=1 FL=1
MCRHGNGEALPAARAHCAGRCAFAKPISCRLYPIRASVLRNGLTALNLHRWEICRCAFEKGRREKVRVYQFLKDPLTDAYGEDFYAELCDVAAALGYGVSSTGLSRIICADSKS